MSPSSADPGSIANLEWSAADQRAVDLIRVLAMDAVDSEVQIALAARDQLAAERIGARVVSMPCVEWFTAQDASYQQEVLPPRVRARVCVEAGVALGWRAFAGDHGECVSLEHFGASADYSDLYRHFGFTADKVAAAARASLARAGGRPG